MQFVLYRVSQNWRNISKIHNFVQKANFEARPIANEREKSKVFEKKMSIYEHFDLALWTIGE